MKVITNNVPRQLIYGYELTDKEKQDFDYLDDIDGHDFVKYKGVVYDISEFVWVDSNSHLSSKWNGYKPDSFFSGTLIKIIDTDSVIMGAYYE